MFRSFSGVDFRKCGKTGDFIEDPGSCKVYWVCEHIGTAWAKVTKMNCPVGLQWITESARRDWPRNAKCNKEKKRKCLKYGN